MAKNKKTVDIPKKKGNAVGVAETNGKFKNKKPKNKKNKKAGDVNSPVKSAVVTEKEETTVDSIASNDQKMNNSSPKKGKKGKNVVGVEATEILSNPKIAKTKKIVATTGSVSPIKGKKKKTAAQDVGDVENVMEEQPTKSDKKRKNSAADKEDEVEVKPASDKKRKNSKATKVEREVEENEAVEDEEVDDEAVEDEDVDDEAEEDEEMDNEAEESSEDDEEMQASPTKQKSKKTKTDEESTDEAAKDKTPLISVFVGNLPINTKRGKILKLFSKFGKVKSIRFRLSNGNKFFKSQSKVTAPNVIAFVDFETLDDAKASLVLNGEKLKDNVLRVNLQSNAKTADSFDGKRTVFVGNLKYLVTDQNLHDLFSCCGDIEYARTMQCDKGCNGIGYVCFKKAESISMALELNNADLLDRPVRVQRYVKKTAGGPNEKKNKKEKPTGAIRRLGKKSQPKGKTFKGKDGKESNAKKQFTGMKAKEKKKKGLVKKNKKPLKGPKLLAKKIASRDKPTKAA